MKPFNAVFAAALALSLVFVPLGDGPLAAGLETQTSRDGGVTVKVTPKDDLAGAEHWDFEVVLETHTVALDQDMAKAAVLVDGTGGVHPAVSWQGDPPGGHHRKGVLRFRAPAVPPAKIELRIAGIGDLPPMVFEWQVGE